VSNDESRPPEPDDDDRRRDSADDPTIGMQHASAFAADDKEDVGRRIGRYHLVRTLGEGGFGTVFEAEQLEPVRRGVALKIIKLGMDTREVIARFEAERQALALMDHPHIARVYDAGATDAGRPFFVMELVDGVPITTYCDEHQLPLRERLTLFGQVCQAIQHAHQKGIIHRDIKPSNVLVSTVDGVPVPKVIDFGIAKATSRSLTEKTFFTEHGQFVGTPEYMSPEQTDLSGVDVDTRSDIYSLGVLLYALLVGSTPFESKTLLSAGFAEIQRIIREVDPPRPSTRASSLGADLDQVAICRREQSARLPRVLRGELDWIVMKSLEKDRSRRYETANGLAMDIERYLSNEPVLASPPSRVYRLRKLVARNRLVFAAATAMVVLLAAGVVGTSFGLVRARQAEARASAEAAKATMTAEFLTDMLQGVGPSVARGRDTELLEEILAETERKIGVQLADQPEVEASIRSFLGTTYYDLGDFEKARLQYERSLEMYRELHGELHEDVAINHNSLALVFWSLADYVEAERQATVALDLRRRIFGEQHRQVANSQRDLANILVAQSRYAEAEAPLAEAIAAQREVLAPENRDELATSLNSMGNVLMHLSRFDEARPLYEEALAIHTDILGHDHPFTVTDLHNLGWLARYQNMHHEAEARFAEAAAISRRIYGESHPKLAESLASHARGLQQLGRYDEAVALARESLAMTSDHFGPDHLATASAMASLSLILTEIGQHEENDRLNQQILAIRKQQLGEDHPQTLSTLQNIAYGYYQRGDYRTAETMFRESLVAYERANGREHHETALVINSLGRALRDAGKLAEAAAMFEEAGAIRAQVLGPDHLMVTVSRHDQANAFFAMGRLDEAAEMLERVVAEYPAHVGAAHRVNAIARCDLAQVELDRDQPARVLALVEPARQIAVAATLGEDDRLVVQCDLMSAAALSHLGRYAEADSVFAAIMPRYAEASAGRAASAHLQFGRHLAATGRFAEAEPLLEAVFAQYRDEHGLAHHRTQRAVRTLVLLYDRWSQTGASDARLTAETWRARLVESGR
jgi:eukaryotic-like serine/threonine-protein kinase